MRLYRVVISTLLLSLCLHEVAGGRSVLRKQNVSNTPTASSVASTRSAKSTISGTGGSPVSRATKSRSTGTGHTTTTAKTATHHIMTTSAGVSGAVKKTQDDSLPVRPSVTAPLGVAGAILMLTGLVYTCIGIKHEWLLVFLSSTYLANLGVTVLIVYLMNPPVSVAIQGAYLIAALFSGLVFGALSLIFKEVTAGLGCLLGGFCLSMWFLVLRPGGLITSDAGTAAFISLLSAAGWSLSFSRYTRDYGLLSCSAFAGATVTIIGIDCFSCAGLKEFWIYIWNLNKQEFPVHTHTYPITRGMRAEIACIIVLFLLGLIAQLKVWKQLKHLRAKKELHRKHSQMQRDQQDLHLGRGVEANNARSLAEWEAVYGHPNAKPTLTQSGSETPTDSFKVKPQVREQEVEAIELDELQGNPSRSSVVQGPRQSHDLQSQGSENGGLSIAATTGDDEDAESLSDRMLRLGKSLRGQKRRSRLSNEVAGTEDSKPAELPLDQEDDEELIKPLSTTDETMQTPEDDGSDVRKIDEPTVVSSSNPAPSETDIMHRTSKWASESVTALKPSGPSSSFGQVQSDKQSSTKGGRNRMFSVPMGAIQRQRSHGSYKNTRGARSASTPLMQQSLVESPIEEEAFASGDTLLNERSARIQNRSGTVNFNAIVPPSNTDLITPSDSVSARISMNDDSDESDMSLARRRTLIKQGRISSASDRVSMNSRQRSASSEQYNFGRLTAVGYQQPPLVSDSARQVAMLSQWRQSLQQLPAGQPIMMAEQYAQQMAYPQYTPTVQYAQQARQNIAEQLRYQDYQQQQRQAAQRSRESMAEMAMRTGEMTNNHRSAMRKMQAQANENLRWGMP